MKIDEAFPSKFLKADADLVNDKGQSTAKRVTIVGVERVEYPNGDKGHCLIFKETDKKFGINKTNWKTVAKITGKSDDQAWQGEQIEIYRTMVEFQGDMVGAIRIRPVGGWPAAVVEEDQPSGSGSPDDNAVPF